MRRLATQHTAISLPGALPSLLPAGPGLGHRGMTARLDAWGPCWPSSGCPMA